VRVSLRPAAEAAFPPMSPAPKPLPLVDPSGPVCVLGASAGGFDQTRPVVPSASTLFGPRGAALAGEDGPLFVADTGHHRVMIWRNLPTQDQTPADTLIGQKDFASEGRNGKDDPSPSTFNVPTGVAASGHLLAVADAWNHRVLIWHGLPTRLNQPADVVLGQADFNSVLPNRGREPAADTLNWCYGVAIAGSRLFVCDTGNRRVLIWNSVPERNGAPADLVLGQAHMRCRDENAGHGVDLSGMRWPHAAAVCGERLFIADAGNNRLMAWNAVPFADGMPCDYLIGQTSSPACEHNRANYWPDAASLNMPYACTTFRDGLAVADTANSRLIGFDAVDFAFGATARWLAGQPDFHAKGDNRWQPPARDSLCWPYGLTSCGNWLVIADSGNNRMLLWRSPP